MDSGDAIQLLVLILLLLLSSYFSSAETALTTCSRIKMRGLAGEGNKKAAVLMKIFEQPNKMLSAILIGNNIVNLTASSMATTLAIDLATKLFGNSNAALASGIATGIITLVVLIFGELSPKTLATVHAEKLALSYANSIYVLMIVLTPVIYVINFLSDLVLRLFRVDPNSHHNAMTELELRTIVDVSHEDGVIESEEHEMITNVVDFGDTQAKEVMVPRIDMVFAQADNTYEEVLEIFKENKFTRLPVYEDNTDTVIGILNIKDLLLYDHSAPFSVRSFLREAYYTYEYKKTAELMMEMRRENFALAIVLDEYGTTAGLITMEDLIEEIVGEIYDEYDDEDAATISKVGDREYIVAGSVHLNDLSDELDYPFESDDFDSIAGFVIGQIDDFPEEHQEITTEDGVRLIVEKMEKNRIETIRIFLPEPEEDLQEF